MPYFFFAAAFLAEYLMPGIRDGPATALAAALYRAIASSTFLVGMGVIPQKKPPVPAYRPAFRAALLVSQSHLGKD